MHVQNTLGLRISIWLFLSAIYTLIYIEFTTNQVSFVDPFLFEETDEVTDKIYKLIEQLHLEKNMQMDKYVILN